MKQTLTYGSLVEEVEIADSDTVKQLIEASRIYKDTSRFEVGDSEVSVIGTADGVDRIIDLSETVRDIENLRVMRSHAMLG